MRCRSVGPSRRPPNLSSTLDGVQHAGLWWPCQTTCAAHPRGGPVRREHFGGRMDVECRVDVEVMMAGVVKKSFGSPDERRTPDKTEVEVVDLGSVKAARMTLQPGWRWSECIKPVVG